MYLFDTDILIWVLRGNEQIVEKVSQMKDRQPVAISVISIAEIYKNIFPSEIINTELFLDSHLQLPIDADIAKQAGFYWQEYSKQYKNFSLTDCFIAASAKTHQATLVTMNAKHFPMTDISVLDPSK